MASKKLLKKEINNTLGALIEEIYVKELASPETDIKKSEKLIDEAIALFDELIQAMHKETQVKAKKHFADIRISLQEKAADLASKIDKL
jgi:hypothetical protein